MHSSTVYLCELVVWLHVISICCSLEPRLGDLFVEYELLSYPTAPLVAQHKRVRRNAKTVSAAAVRLPLLTCKQNLTLVLFPDVDLIGASARLTVGGVDHPKGLSGFADYIYRGYVDSYPNSIVFGSIIQGVFRGTVSLDESLRDTFYIEPAANYFDYKTNFHSIMYHEQHVKFDGNMRRIKRSTPDTATFNFCGLSNPDIARRMAELRSPISGVDVNTIPRRSRRASSPRPLNVEIGASRLHPDFQRGHPSAFTDYRLVNPYTQRQSAPVDGANTRVCNLYLQSDTFLWDRVIGMQHIRGNRELAVQEITSIFTQHVQGAQAIYQHTLFRDHAGRLEYPGISFRVDHVLINVTEEDCKPRPVWRDLHGRPLPSPTALPRRPGQDKPSVSNASVSRGSYADENPFCAENIDVTNYLNLHSYTPHDDFCLAYVFTYRDFSGGTLGLAWVAEPNGSGGVCEKHRLMREGSHNVYKSLNTGVVTLLNYGSQVALKVSQLTFAHEMGHNFGAKHDDDHKSEPFGCLPSVDDPRGNYIMFASATSGDKDNNNKFSLCSLDSIARLLGRVLSDDSNCFLKSDGPFCGNQLTEEGEQCDCGFTKSSCRDQCCHPKESSSPCKLRDTIWVNDSSLQVQCSPTAGECCTHNCQFRGTSHLCRGADECYRSAYCNGVEAKCPTSEHLPDGTPCQDHTRICKQGQCIGSICERIPGWHECSLVRNKNVTPEMMCFVSCRENRTGAPCISTFQLEQDSNLRDKYPQLVNELLRDGRGTKLKPGAPCDNYRGYCDVFHRCRSVEAEGPLARLRNLLFSPQVLEQVKSWITMHWWAVILICVSLIIALIVFAKLCAVSTPPSRYYSIPVRHTRSSVQTSSHPSRDWSAPYPPPSFHMPSPWAWPRRTRPADRNGKRGRRTPRSKSLPFNPSSSLATESRRVIPSAPFLDPMDFPPPNARPTPIHCAISNSRKPNAERGDIELIPFALLDLSQPAASTSSNDQVDRRRRNSEKSSNRPSASRSSVPRPVSMLDPDSGGRRGQASSSQHVVPGKKSKLPSKIKRPRDDHAHRRPTSLVVVVEDPLTVVESNEEQLRVAQNPVNCDSSIPPPAYDDL
ncbi:Disintegrin and metalloproteinase domain-containing protein 10 [Clonorchis sinensis]|uniref:ADAM10 endopeptidase n=1 Tax=Clonorchis sinensis TaxID=79923 RepID=A0A8T1MAG6_CLOSI|nr:Disintegrin and metalloproteinase domain-containing protein 10 [Clonorchis sinensis]